MNTAESQSDITIVYVVFQEDLPNLYLSLVTLTKHWKGPKKVLIIAEDGCDPAPYVLKALPTGWSVKIQSAPQTHETRGWYRQQMFKLYSSFYVDTEWSNILDAKNMLYKDIAASYFINSDYIYVIGHENIVDTRLTKWEWQYVFTSMHMAGGEDTKIFPYCLTPWVFNNTLTRDLCTKTDVLNIRDWNITEFYLYWYWTNKKLPYKAHYDLSGAYGNFTVNLDHIDHSNIINIHRYCHSDRELIIKLVSLLYSTDSLDTNHMQEFYQMIKLPG